MGSKRFAVKPNEALQKCPVCGNNTTFLAHSNQVAEDCCEIWIACECGFDPTAENTANRLEDVMGTLGEIEIEDALDIWNQLNAEIQEKLHAGVEEVAGKHITGYQDNRLQISGAIQAYGRAQAQEFIKYTNEQATRVGPDEWKWQGDRSGIRYTADQLYNRFLVWQAQQKGQQ